MKKIKHAIRPAEFEDAEAIFNLIRKNPETLLPRSISDIRQNIDRFFVCSIADRIIGSVSWQILPEIGTSRKPSVEIQSLAVEADFQRAGIGSTLVQAALNRTRALHPSQIIVLTFYPDFFRTLGFTETPKERLMHKIYMGCVSCAKYDSPFTCPETAMTLDPAARQALKKQ